ncbi:hypothetical protein AR679_gp116 [Yellowstone lake phycodnavirus 1]|uniref:hypothetical protein n=1 Tax=Yellowstone lake phycodnavirus 1 TaxID=1586713 RepID=UPI0006EBB7E6|nr:hypothetical protein AR679_gp116 [Yellowstone lake phycodnavirus 1]BAT22142.1 hypothetical protein [Yellowstone lake phycodnavirus 1]
MILGTKVLSLGNLLLDLWACSLLLGWLGGRLGLWRLGSLGLGDLVGRLLHVVGADVLLDVHEGDLNALWGVQQILQWGVQSDVLAILQALLRQVGADALGHISTGDLLIRSQTQEAAQLLGHNLGLAETIAGGASLCLLAVGILQVLADLANVLAQRLDLLCQILECQW